MKLYEGQYVDTLLTQKAVEWLRQERTKPFCLFLWFYAPHAPFYRPKDMVNDFNGVPIPKPATFDEDLKDYPGKPRAVADADNKIGYSEVFSDDPRSLEELVKDHYVGVQDNDRNVGAIWQELERQKIAAKPPSCSALIMGSFSVSTIFTTSGSCMSHPYAYRCCALPGPGKARRRV